MHVYSGKWKGGQEKDNESRYKGLEVYERRNKKVLQEELVGGGAHDTPFLPRYLLPKSMASFL